MKRNEGIIEWAIVVLLLLPLVAVLGLWVYLYKSGVIEPTLYYGVMFSVVGIGIFLLMFLKRRDTRKRRIREHRCLSCDYDLRVTIEVGKVTCPECGTIITTDPAEPTPPPVK